MTTKPPTDDKPATITGTQAPKRRTRGPNKPKPAALVDVETSARMSQAAIIKVITEYVTTMLDAETAAGMELQVTMPAKSDGVSDGSIEWRPITDHDAPKIRFVTKGSK